MEIAGSVVVQIGGNLAPFEAALAKASQMAATFDAQISAELSGAGVSEGLAKIAAGVDKTNALLMKLTGAASATDKALGGMATESTRASVSIKEVGASSAAATASVQTLSAAVQANKVAATGGFAATATASKLASFEMRNLKYQLIDIAQSIPQAFQSPIYFLQNMGYQVAQIGQIFMGRGGLGAALSELGNMAGSFAGKFAKVGLVLTGAVSGFLSIKDAASQAEQRTVGFGETFTALIDVLRQGAIGQSFSAIWSPISYALEKLGSAAVDIGELIINVFHAGYISVQTLWNTFPDMLGHVFVMAANQAVDALNWLVKKSSDAIDSIASAFNNIPGVNIPLLNAPEQTIAPMVDKYVDSMKAALSAGNEEIKKALAATPIRDFGQAVVDKIQTNHALEGLQSLGNVSFDKSIGGANALGSSISGVGKAADGVSVEFGGVSQQVINITRLFEDAKRSQLIGLEQSQQQLIGMKHDAEELQKTLAAASSAKVSDVFGSAFSGSGGEAAIANAASSIDKVFKAFDEGRLSIKGVDDAIQTVRQSLLQMGGSNQSVNEFVNEIVNGQLKVRELTSNVNTLSTSIRNIPNKTVTITVRTQQIGSGTQSIYDVPNQSGGTSGVGVTRYGGNGGQSGPSITSNEVPRTSGYGSMGGGGDLGSTNVNVTRFATGGMIHPGDTQSVSFFKSPDETVGIFTPGQMQALADPQSGFNGTQSTANDNRAWTVLMNIEANTRKTAQLLDEVKTSMASSSSSLGGSSYGGGSLSGASGDPLTAQYLQVLKQIRSNFAANGIVGGGSIGYGGQGLAATPQQIARTIVYGGQSSVGSASGYVNQHGGENYTSPTARAKLAAMSPSDPNYAAAYAGVYGFNSGGMIAPGDTQEVKFFKSPDEAVAIFTPQQLKAVQGANQNQPAAAHVDGRPIVVNQTHNWNGDAPPSKDSIAEMRRQTALAVREAMRSINGR